MSTPASIQRHVKALHPQYTHRPVHLIQCLGGYMRPKVYIKTWNDGSVGYVVSLDDGKLYQVV
jgi:DNA-binding transcriptional MocR family regulator